MFFFANAVFNFSNHQMYFFCRHSLAIYFINVGMNVIIYVSCASYVGNLLPFEIQPAQ